MQVGSISREKAEKHLEAYDNGQRCHVGQGDMNITLTPHERNEDNLSATITLGMAKMYIHVLLNVIADDVDSCLTIIGTQGTTVTFPMVD